MSGHNKWSNTRYRKKIQDNKKDKIFSKIIKELNSAIKIGQGINPQYNSKLRLVIEKALSYNINRSTIDNILKKNINNKKNDKLKEIFYEGYGPDNVALMIKCLTDNNNRTVSFIRHILNKSGGNLYKTGTINYIFKKQIYVTYSSINDSNHIINIAKKLNANDIIFNKKNIKIIFTQKKYKFFTKKIKKLKIKPIKTKLIIKPFFKKKINILIKKELINLLFLSKKCKDIKKIYHNAEI
ncbi:YebC/PmpR family DNA-binding transcriptional regulator [Enterobacteriaceae endosymbiont of Donacia semicuprea]|uniref:YebC/PmpR family DNA-binding transcriptional regulator n=1 Tax=Enterobacteriaceae endosymbiont of Donacia semicuprea TaxID=2675783 RepID=UPI001448ECF5|nr:YebC/PmpR family DNA-binding transcriptional regulator [Enterobacteriaceae endosymbiont of Donacia semicuprea]QJC33058.1 hypothetical protein GJT91_02075 [Enterobacteriaceae endosymbiont of Donacia semicuprea]